jgi:hypothetical protein
VGDKQHSMSAISGLLSGPDWGGKEFERYPFRSSTCLGPSCTILRYSSRVGNPRLDSLGPQRGLDPARSSNEPLYHVAERAATSEQPLFA